MAAITVGCSVRQLVTREQQIGTFLYLRLVKMCTVPKPNVFILSSIYIYIYIYIMCVRACDACVRTCIHTYIHTYIRYHVHPSAHLRLTPTKRKNRQRPGSAALTAAAGNEN